MEQPVEVLLHEQVELRRWRVEDVDVLDRIVVESLAHLRPWMPWAAEHSRDSALQYLVAAQDEWEDGRAFNYAIVSDGRPVGSASLVRRIGPGGLEIGYWLHPGWTGRGLVTMAVAALTRAAFELPGVTHVEIHHDEANKASGAVPQRLGYTVVSRTPDAARGAAPGESGVSVVHRLDRA
ncbi:GNAT family N-acetyltransferase [Streptacidiphilus sp. EB129]|uniref:GNAT family N-acetyltransferase n=1 Tax=Streptacidiphilus sp. EB129 TaxID=3156262 RepID=UPI003511CC63